MTHYCGLEDGDKQSGRPRELRWIPGQEPAMKWRPQFYKHKELNSADNLNEVGSGFSLNLQSRIQPS